MNTVRIRLIAGAVLILIGVGFALLSKEWIEETLGFEPDGGSGALELAFVLVPVGIGVALLVSVVSGFSAGGIQLGCRRASGRQRSDARVADPHGPRLHPRPI